MKKIILIFLFLYISLQSVFINDDILSLQIIKTNKEIINISYLKKYNDKNSDNDVFLIGIYLFNTKAKNHKKILQKYVSVDKKIISKIVLFVDIYEKKINDSKQLSNNNKIVFHNKRAKYFLVSFKKTKEQKEMDKNNKIRIINFNFFHLNNKTAIFHSNFK